MGPVMKQLEKKYVPMGYSVEALANIKTVDDWFPLLNQGADDRDFWISTYSFFWKFKQRCS